MRKVCFCTEKMCVLEAALISCMPKFYAGMPGYIISMNDMIEIRTCNSQYGVKMGLIPLMDNCF